MLDDFPGFATPLGIGGVPRARTIGNDVQPRRALGPDGGKRLTRVTGTIEDDVCDGDIVHKAWPPPEAGRSRLHSVQFSANAGAHAADSIIFAAQSRPGTTPVGRKVGQL